MKNIIKLFFCIYLLFYTISSFAHEINNCSCESDCYTEEIKDLYCDANNKDDGVPASNHTEEFFSLI